jgi:hypothetical protein
VRHDFFRGPRRPFPTSPSFFSVRPHCAPLIFLPVRPPRRLLIFLPWCPAPQSYAGGAPLLSPAHHCHAPPPHPSHAAVGRPRSSSRRRPSSPSASQRAEILPRRGRCASRSRGRRCSPAVAGAPPAAVTGDHPPQWPEILPCLPSPPWCSELHKMQARRWTSMLLVMVPSFCSIALLGIDARSTSDGS